MESNVWLTPQHQLLQMASITPFNRIVNWQSHSIQQRVQIFRRTRVFNHLLPSGHKRQAYQSYPSGTRRLNRGNCHAPKFALLLLKIIHISILKYFTRVDQTNPLLSNQSKLGFFSSQVKMDFQCFKWSSYLIICLKGSPCQISSLISQDCSSNCSDGWNSIVLDRKSIVVNI